MCVHHTIYVVNLMSLVPIAFPNVFDACYDDDDDSDDAINVIYMH